MKQLKIFIITGLSGSGKSTAMTSFEDAGYYCVDNMPVILLPKFLELPIDSNNELSGLAFVMDIRERNFLSEFPSVFKSLKEKNYDFEILFLEADEDILVQRYSQTRRYHPLFQGKGIRDAIRLEKEQLKQLRESSDRIINTSHYSPHQLKAIIKDIAQKNKKQTRMRIQILSFGFKYGIPTDTDLIVDVRFITNPYFIPELKPYPGTSEQIKNFVLNQKEARTFLNKYIDLLTYLIPLYEKEGKSYLTISIGCTGGRHRSVVLADAIYENLIKLDYPLSITHRDIDIEA